MDEDNAPNHSVAILGTTRNMDYLKFVDTIVTFLFPGQFPNAHNESIRYNCGVAPNAKSLPFRCESIITGSGVGTDDFAARFAHDAMIPCTRLSVGTDSRSTHAKKLLGTVGFAIIFVVEKETRNIAALLKASDYLEVPIVTINIHTDFRMTCRCVLLGVSNHSIAISEPFFYLLAPQGGVVADDLHGRRSLAVRELWLKKLKIDPNSKFVIAVRFASRNEFQSHKNDNFRRIRDVWQKLLAGMFTIYGDLKVTDELAERYFQNDPNNVVFNIDAPVYTIPIHSTH